MRKLTLAIAVLAIGCSGKKKSEQLDTTSTEAVNPVGSGSGSGSAGSGSAAPAKPAPIVVKDGFAVPESVLHDTDADVYLVANINGEPAKVDNDGFISKVSPEGKITELKWIEGGKNGVKLDAPKGMAISGGVLWIADITVVRKFDAKTGKPAGEVKVPGATFLNDVVAGPDGGIFVTDMGVDAKFAPSGSDAIYSIGKTGKLIALAKAKELGGPNGIVESKGTVTVVTFGGGSLFTVPAVPAVGPPAAPPKQTKLPKGQLDGIIALDSGEFLVSSWEGKTVYRGRDATWTDLALNIDSPADIGYDAKRKKLLIPSFQKNELWIVEQ